MNPNNSRSTPRQIGLRLYVCASVVVSASIAAGEAGSLNARLLEASGPVGKAVIAVMVAMALVCLLDTLVNDMMRAPGLPWLAEQRSSGYVALGVLNLAWLWVMISRDLGTMLMLRYALDAAACVWVAAFDVRFRYVQQRRDAEQPEAAP